MISIKARNVISLKLAVSAKLNTRFVEMKDQGWLGWRTLLIGKKYVIQTLACRQGDAINMNQINKEIRLEREWSSSQCTMNKKNGNNDFLTLTIGNPLSGGCSEVRGFLQWHKLVKYLEWKHHLDSSSFKTL